MNNGKFGQRFTRIPGLSDRRRLPRLGIIRLGVKKQTAKGVDYPTETDYFVCPPEVEAVYGKAPKELDVMLPLDDIDAVMPVAYKWYGKTMGLKCHGNGLKADRYDQPTNDWLQRDCPCECLDDGRCKAVATLNVILPKVSLGGVYHISTRSYHSIVDVASGIEYTQQLVGRANMIPLKLRRMPQTTFHDQKKQTHYTLKIMLDVDIDTLNALLMDSKRIVAPPRYALPVPVDEPDFDNSQIVDLEDEDKKAPAKQKSKKKEQPEPDTDYPSPLEFKRLYDAGRTKNLNGEETRTVAKYFMRGERLTRAEFEDLCENFEARLEEYLDFLEKQQQKQLEAVDTGIIGPENDDEVVI